jgi:hypothetical protein
MGRLNPGKFKCSITSTGIGDTTSNAENLEDMVRQISLASTSAIDWLIGDLKDLRDKLENDANRLETDIAEYESLNKSAGELTRIISDSVTRVKKVPGIPRGDAAEKAVYQAPEDAHGENFAMPALPAADGPLEIGGFK